MFAVYSTDEDRRKNADQLNWPEAMLLFHIKLNATIKVSIWRRADTSHRHVLSREALSERINKRSDMQKPARAISCTGKQKAPHRQRQFQVT